ncbi:hypothetical protein VJ918_03210 [Adlercreutzia sp. R21]|uniref:hypothetical protein n=1 Tax=Adlercreutzia wanghongyangiae TaxID=3111451 RepID=UPI002DB692E6|nr:hypothetical protein [Adlercreutzia sp. R21]MEC4183811.1 hypothetical protein [Adlercreutzia sp. R21]
MNVYLSHSTALLFWRSWSAAAAIPLRAFHDLGVADASLLPTSFFPTSGVLCNEAVRSADVQSVMEEALQSLACARVAGPSDAGPAASTGGRDSCSARVGAMPSQAAAVMSALEEVARSQGGAPLHIMVAKGHGTRNSGDLVRHRSAVAFPRQSFVKVAPGVFVCSPELVFVQMAALLTRGGLLAVGYELCGCYPLGEERAGVLVRRPLSSPCRLAAFAARASGLTGVKAARSAAKQVLAKSGSLMETEVSVIAFSLFSQGGLGLRAPLLNEPVVLSDRAKAATGLSRVVCDWLWPAERVVLEYDGHDAHSSPQQQAHDARKRDALRIDGFSLAIVTSSQFHHVSQCAELLRGVARSVGQRSAALKPEHLPRHMALREQVRKHHRAHFPSRFRRAHP